MVHARTAALAVVSALLLLALLAPPAMAAPRNVEEWNGRVTTLAHKASGRAAVVRVGGGRRFLTLQGFRIDPGPRVQVYLVAGRVRGDRDVRDFKDLGRLKGSRGNQQYEIPRGVNVRRYRTVVFWCVPFTQALAKAELRPS